MWLAHHGAQCSSPDKDKYKDNFINKLHPIVIGPFQGTNMILYYAFKFPGNIHKSALDFHVEHPYF